MTPSARIQAAVELLDAFMADPRAAPADRLLLRWGRGARYAGAKDRAAVADLVYDGLRRWRSLGWPDESGGARARMLAMAAEAGELDAAFDGRGHGAARPGGAERAFLEARAAGALDDAPEAVRLDAPDWLWPVLRGDLGEAAAPVLRALRRRAPVDLRVNRLKTDPETARERLAAEGVATEPGPLGPLCLRVTAGARALRRAGAWLDGWVEVQDAASQAAALFARARPGERVLDFCTGGGGKALALAAETGGEIVAHDADPRRMADLPARAARAGARVRPTTSPEGRFDLVFVDAPCSGSGAWRRNPDAKWAFSAADLARLTALQGRVLAEASRFAAPGGRVVYATCSLLEAENGGATAAAGLAVRAELRLTPLDGGDGFFASWLSDASG